MFFMNDAEVFTPSIRVELPILFFGVLSPFPIVHSKARDKMMKIDILSLVSTKK